MRSNLFPTPIWHSRINIPPDLIQRIYTLRESSEGRTYSNVGGWQSNDIDQDPNFTDIVHRIYNVLQDVYDELWIHEKKTPKLQSTWININKGDEHNISHIHPLSHIAGCVYIKCNENSGPICFENPLQHIIDHYDLRPSEVIPFKANYKPTVGEVILFPSWVRHSVLPSTDNEDRISIAFNSAI